MSGSNCYFLTCIQVSQEAGKVVWYSHLFKNSPQFAVIHTVKGFSLVNESDVFLKFCCFFYDAMDVGNLISAFLKSSCTSGNSWFTYCWSLAWRILSTSLLACEMTAKLCSSLNIFGIALLWDWKENWPFQVLWLLLSFPNLLAYWVQHFNTIIF